MQTYHECLACLVKQTVEIANGSLPASEREGFIRDMLRELADFDYASSPPMMAMDLYGRARTLATVNDPYAEIKRHYNDLALDLCPELRERINASPDPVDTALRVAVAGNIIDFGAGTKASIAVEQTIERALTEDFAVDHRPRLRRQLADARSILYIGDNAGEIVFDRLFIEQLTGDRVTFATRSVPVINDATLDDARQAGLFETCTVTASGSHAPGTPLELCSPEFRDLFMNADLVISKGQGNFETLTNPPRPVFFLFMAKCPVIAREADVPQGSFVVMQRGE